MFSQIVPLVLLLATISNATLTCNYCNNYEMGKECSRGHLESKTCSGRESLCETRWQNGNDLTWSGCSGEQGMPAEAMECDKVNCKVQCTNYGKQDRCVFKKWPLLDSHGAVSRLELLRRTCGASAHLRAAIRRRPTLKAARFSQAEQGETMESQFLHFSQSGLYSHSAVNKRFPAHLTIQKGQPTLCRRPHKIL